MAHKTLHEQVFACIDREIFCHSPLSFPVSVTLASFSFSYVSCSLSPQGMYIDCFLCLEDSLPYSYPLTFWWFLFFRPQFNCTFLKKPSLIPSRRPSVPVLHSRILPLVSFISYNTIIIKRLLVTLPTSVSSSRTWSRGANLFYLIEYSQGIIQSLAQRRQSINICWMKK